MKKIVKKFKPSMLLIITIICVAIIVVMYGCKKDSTPQSNGVAAMAEGMRILCPRINTCCGLCSFACTGTGNPVTLDNDQVSGLSVAAVSGDSVIVTNTFDKTNMSTTWFNAITASTNQVLSDTAGINSSLLKAVYADSKITGFPTDNVIIPKGNYKVNIVGNPQNNKLILIQKYFIAKNGVARIEHTVQAK